MKRAEDCKDELMKYLADYSYQPALTKILDAASDEDFDQKKINEIVLWKVNRYAKLSEEGLGALNSAAKINPGKHREASGCIEKLLRETGVDLPMASTFLRFRNSKTFQIIDRHAYRAITGNPYRLYSHSKESEKVALYFDYLDGLLTLAKMAGLNFKDMDRILYIFDKQENGAL